MLFVQPTDKSQTFELQVNLKMEKEVILNGAFNKIFLLKSKSCWSSIFLHPNEYQNS